MLNYRCRWRGIHRLALVAMPVAVFISHIARVNAAPGDATIPANFKIVAQDDCGNPKSQPDWVAGKAWAAPLEVREKYKFEDARLATASRGVIVTYRYQGLRTGAQYYLRVVEFSELPGRAQSTFLNNVELHAPHDVPVGVPQILTYKLPADSYKDHTLNVEFRKTGEQDAAASAIELWSDQDGIMGPAGSYIRFRIDAWPDKVTQWKFTGTYTIHSSPWHAATTFTPKPVTQLGYTEWYNLNGANAPLTISLPPGGRGVTQFSTYADPSMIVRELDWNEPDGNLVIVNSGLSDVRTFREQERRYYLNALENTPALRPLARPPLLFANAWGWAPANAMEYMAKSFRLIGLNSVAVSTEPQKYADLYGWTMASGAYWPPTFMPYDEKATAAKYDDYFKTFF